MKTLKFRPHLIDLILSGKKNVTYRLFDDKDLMVGDELVLKNWETLEDFAQAKIIEIKEKRLSDLTEEDLDGHEKFENTEEMYKIYKEYYGDGVTPETIVKIIKFELI